MSGKRLFDIVLALILCVPILPALAVLYVIVVMKDGRPFLYRSERMKTPQKPFQLYKIRTMREAPSHENQGVTGGHKEQRITKLGRKLRRHRIDEFPQIFNVLKGDMSFVGPRPPERRFVEAFPEVYAEVLRDRPGITGLATIIYHAFEGRMLAKCSTPEETEAVYCRRAVPRKARLDRMYHDNRSLSLDLWIMYLTAAKLVPLPGRRARRIRGK